MIIEVNVSNKIARLADKNTVAVCENSDYVIHFNFDEEWAKFETKTARFKWGGKYTDVVFTGNECAMPIVNNVYSVKIGVYAGDLHTTTSALLMMKKSIRCGNEPESSASQEVRNEFLDVLDKRTGDLSALKTTSKDNLVAAINEAAASGGSAEVIKYTSQVLTDEQKEQARKNIDAASDFVVNATLNLDRTAALDKTFGQMSEALAAGKNPIVHVRLGNENTYLKMSVYTTSFMVFTNIGMQDDGRFGLALTLTVTNDKATYGVSYLLAADGGQHLPQISMAADPTEDMQIATKKYVDDKEFILQSTTPNSTKRFKITVDDGGILSAVEVTE